LIHTTKKASNFCGIGSKDKSVNSSFLNNLQKGNEAIASTLLVTIFLRTLAAHYDDKQQVKFVPGQEMSNRTVMEMNILAQNDYREMEMDKLSYDWMWDTLFFGRGFMETL